MKYFKIISLWSIQEDKKKRDRDRVENEAEKDLPCQAPAGLDLPPEKPLAGSLAKQEGWENWITRPEWGGWKDFKLLNIARESDWVF